MEFVQLRYFLSLAQTQNLTRTAEAMHVTPSAVSIGISKLEKELEVSLFLRTTSGMHLSPFGQAILPQVESLLLASEEIHKTIAQMQTGNENTVSIAFDDPLFFGEFFRRFHHKNPEIRLVQLDGNVQDTTSLQRLKRVDFLCTAIDMSHLSGWEQQLLFEDRVVLAVPESHPLSWQSAVSLSDIMDERFLMRSEDDYFQKFINAVFDKHGFTPKYPLECHYALRPQLLSSSSDCIVVTTLLAVKGAAPTVYPENTKILKIREFSGVRYPKYLCWRSGMKFTRAMQQFFKDLTAFSSDWVERSARDADFSMEFA